MKKKDMKKRNMTKGLAMIITALLLTAVCVSYAHAATYLKGDIDNSGSVTLKDAQLALRAALNIDKMTPETTMRGDVDGNGDVNLKDAQQI